MLVEKLDAPLIVSREETFVVRRRIDSAAAFEAARAAIVNGLTRPVDIAEATELDAPLLMWLPVWRVEGGAEGFSIGMPRDTSTGNLHSGPRRQHTGPLALIARRPLPFTLALTVDLGDMLSAASAPQDAGDVIDANVSRSMAEERAKELFKELDEQVLFSRYKAKIQRADFVLFPIFYVGYGYRGAVRKTSATDRHWVVVSGRDARVAGASHPSAVRAIAHRLRRLLTF